MTSVIDGWSCHLPPPRRQEPGITMYSQVPHVRWEMFPVSRQNQRMRDTKILQRTWASLLNEESPPTSPTHFVQAWATLVDGVSELSSLLQDSPAPSRPEDPASMGREHKIPFCTALLQPSCQQSCCVARQWTFIQTDGTSECGPFERIIMEEGPSRNLLHHVTMSVIM